MSRGWILMTGHYRMNRLSYGDLALWNTVLLASIITCVHRIHAIGVRVTSRTNKDGQHHLNTADVSFADFEDCLSPAKVSFSNVFPNLENEMIEMELHATHVDDNLTYWTKTTLDTVNSRGLVEMDFQGNRDSFVFDLIKKKAFRMFGNRMCREEPMESTSCNPLSYFILQTANKTLTDCSFHASTPAADTLSSLERIRWGLASRKWKQCLRFQQNQMHFFYLVKYIFRPASFSYSNRKYTPVRIETTMLHPNNGKSGTRNLVVFDFVSFSSHAKDRISDSTIPAIMNCSSGSNFKSVSSTSISTTTKRRTTYRKGLRSRRYGELARWNR